MRICLVSHGLEERNRFIQPWRYIFRVAGILSQSGHDICLVTDGYPRLPRDGRLSDWPVMRLPSLQDWPLYGNRHVAMVINRLHPDIVLWHLGLPRFLRLSTLRRIRHPVVGIVTSPIYEVQELLQLGLSRLSSNFRLSLTALFGAITPGSFVRRALVQGLVDHLVVESETTRRRLIDRGAPSDHVHLIRPNIDGAWFRADLRPVKLDRIRGELGFSSEEFIIGYFGSPKPLRGLRTLVRAAAIAVRSESNMRLLVLSRLREGELIAEHRDLLNLIERLGLARSTHVIAGFLPRDRLINAIATCDVVALPFQLVPSDVPLSVLESLALGKPVITTQVGCLPELVPKTAGLCIPPGDVPALAKAMVSLATDKGLCQVLSQGARQHAVNWRSHEEDTSLWSKLLDRHYGVAFGGNPANG